MFTGCSGRLIVKGLHLPVRPFCFATNITIAAITNVRISRDSRAMKN
jgi:hypothetical protein